ncbi:hypothetical protein WR25_11987 isoform F [Diploscapter pachys]|uniref:Phosphoinositide phospholipase C n=2 Tax=Diploscapter pachys TaxID=2018661 RepID=A0A2A2K6B9_9BILA|nr:hypothetical protein WR25_11987 isoform A [Diploscapter pachys]PAV69504.1 hypothetical protein WR25_11987 isoform B [Diploscapter pachys]PAV69505.1 hypothetical protein WR25_11987 isoform C [Diploscapter pachys]PAV69508.1 hypothetical protein WR25_11987 isoform F [Diploscapter pachys]
MAQQNKMVEIFKEYFKEMLLCQPLENHPLDGRPLPSPEQLKYKILVKAKRCKVPKISRDHSYDTATTASSGSLSFSSDENYSTVNSKKSLISLGSTDSGESLPAELPKELISLTEQELRCVFIPEKEEISYTQLSSLVNYMESDRPANFSLAERRPHILCSVDEDVSWRYFKEKKANHLLKITTRRIVRVYPKNFRICSDNYFPMNHWAMGVQMVALNYQTPGIEMLLNQAMFERNDSCGYVLKPECMRNPWELIDIHSSTPQVPNRSSVVLKIKILSGHFYSHIVKPSALQRCSCPLLARQQNADPITTYVTVQVFDLPEYEKSKCYRTKESTEEATVTKYSHKSSSKIFLFEKIVLSELAYVHFCVWQRAGCHSVPIAHKLIPVEKLNNGYRNITLRNVNNQCIGPASLFVLFDVHYFSTQRAISRALALPFDDEKRERDFVTAVINPFMSEPEERPIMKLEELDGHMDMESSNISNLNPTISNLYQRKLSNPQVTPTKSSGNLLKKISGFLKA